MQSHLPPEDSAVVFATTTDGLRLPVIDVTHPAFAIPDDPASLAARRDAFLAFDRRGRSIGSSRVGTARSNSVVRCEDRRLHDRFHETDHL